MSFILKSSFFLCSLHVILSSVYPKNENISSFPKAQERVISIGSKKEITDYINSSDYIIAVFHQDWCGHCRHFLPIFKQVSSYQMVNKFQFLEINCSQKEICEMFKIEYYPTIKVFLKGSDIKAEPPRDLESLLEYLEKLIVDPIITITNEAEFHSQFGTFSPIVHYSKQNTEFISCVSMLAKRHFLQRYYFGTLPWTDENENETIIFNFDGSRVMHTWDRDCTNVHKFLNQNKYPLVNEINTQFIRKVMKEGLITSMLFYNGEISQQKDFVFKYYKNISIKYRDIVFGYVDAIKDQKMVNYFNLKFKKGLLLLIQDFEKDVFYLHPVEFDYWKEEKDIQEEIEKVFRNFENLHFTTGHYFYDLLIKVGLRKVVPYTKYILIGWVISIIFIAVWLVIWCDNSAEEEKKEVKKEKKE